MPDRTGRAGDTGLGAVADLAALSVEFASASPLVCDARRSVRRVRCDGDGSRHGTLDVIVRPWFRRMPGGDWSKEMYQLQMRYQPSTRVPLRIDAGIISSPLGIIALEMRPDRNPIIGTPSYYFSPLPSFDGRFDRVSSCRAAIRSAPWRARPGASGMRARA